jgi:hypothetical protein
MRAALVYNDYDAIAAPLGRTLHRLGLPLETASENWSRAARRAARTLIEVADENILREQGIYRTDARLASTFRCAPDRATNGLSPVVLHGLPPAPSAVSSNTQPSRAIPTPTAQPAHAPPPNEPCRQTPIQQVQHAGANMALLHYPCLRRECPLPH